MQQATRLASFEGFEGVFSMIVEAILLPVQAVSYCAILSPTVLQARRSSTLNHTRRSYPQDTHLPAVFTKASNLIAR